VRLILFLFGCRLLRSSQNLVNLPEEFFYDKNGNMTKDLDRDIVTVQYNLLNLPTLIQFRNGNQIMHTYTAAGQKLKTEYFTVRIQSNIPLATGDIATHTLQTAAKTGTVYSGNKEYSLEMTLRSTAYTMPKVMWNT